jgi:hypothetical protein
MEELKVTEGGLRYLEDGELKIRQDISNRRIEEDGETFDEYRSRLKHIKHFLKMKKRGSLLWDSRRGPFVKAEFREYLKQVLANGTK